MLWSAAASPLLQLLVHPLEELVEAHEAVARLVAVREAGVEGRGHDLQKHRIGRQSALGVLGLYLHHHEDCLIKPHLGLQEVTKLAVVLRKRMGDDPSASRHMAQDLQTLPKYVSRTGPAILSTTSFTTSAFSASSSSAVSACDAPAGGPINTRNQGAL